MRYRLTLVWVVLLLGCCALLGYASGGKGETGGTGGGAVAAGVTFPESFPKVPKKVDPSVYAYDDMSKKYDFEVMTYGYIVQPVADNPITNYLNKKLNANITFTDTANADLGNQVTVRFASGSPPDFIHLGGTDPKTTAITLFQQGQTLDPTPYLQYIPQAMTYITTAYRDWATVDGKMFGIPRYPTFPDNWGLYIRSDWLAKFGMTKPKTEEELFQYALACATKDPDGNGKADTWFMGGASAGQNMGMLDQIRNMFGHTSWNVSGGKINNPVLDGTNRDFLKFLNRLYTAGALHPDWYTIEWEQFKSFSMTDKIGMVNYPGWNLISETWNAHGQNLDSVKVWEALDPPKSNTGRGGMYAPGGAPGGLMVLAKGLEKDQGKLKRILHFYDSIVYPNENYWAVSQGGDENIYPGMSRIVFNAADGTNVFQLYTEKHPAYKDPNLNPLWNWQTLGFTLIWQVYDDPMGTIGSKWNQYVIGLPRHKNYDIFVTLDAEKLSRITELARRAEIEFVLGKRPFTDWDKYVAEWKQAGGADLLAQAASQLKVAVP